jgi:hypothetical protein
MEEGLTLNFIHNSLKPLMVKDERGNYPFWYRCSAIDTVENITEDYTPIKDVFSLIDIKPRTSDNYALKKGYLLLKHKDTLYRYILNGDMCDYDLQPFIDSNTCWFKECEIIYDESLGKYI